MARPSGPGGVVTLTLEHVSLTFSEPLAMAKHDRGSAYPFGAKS